jgi:tetratricopeptide (TPR) repeat protein
MGKSTVARQLVREMPDRGAGDDRIPVWEVSAADLSSLTGGLITVAAGLGASESDLQAIANLAPTGPDRFWRLLEQAPPGWLLIIDNADQPELLAAPAAPGAANMPRLHDGNGWVRATQRGLVLVTSRRRESRRPENLRNKSNQNVIWPEESIFYAVPPLSDSEAAKVLRDWAPMAGDLDQARKLGHRLGGLPLALRLAGQYLSSEYVSNASFAAYLTALESDPRMIRRMDPDLDDPNVEREMVMFTWELSLNALADYGLPQARPMLRLVSCYAAAVPIPLSMLASELLEPLLRTSAGSVESSAATSVQVDQVLRGLDHLGLIEAARMPASTQEGTSRKPGRRRLLLNQQNALVVHPVIADTNRVYLLEPTPSDPDPRLVRSTAVSLLAAVLDGLEDDQPKDWPACRTLTPHLQALLANSASRLSGDALDVLVRVTGHTAIAYGQMRSPEFGLELVTSALGYTSQRAGDPVPAVLAARQQRAHLLSQVGRSRDAEKIYRDVLSVQRRRWPDDESAILATRYNLAAAVAGQEGRLAEARTSFGELLEEQRRVLGNDHQYTFATRLQLAMLMYRAQEWSAAEGALRSLLSDEERVLGPQNPSTLPTRHNLALVILRQGRKAEAETLRQALLEDERRLLGEDHFLTVATTQFRDGEFITTWLFSGSADPRDAAISLLSKAARLSEQQQPAQAIEVFQQLIDRFGDDPACRQIVAEALLHHGAALADMERRTEALLSVERAVNLYEVLVEGEPGAYEERLNLARQLLTEVRRDADRPDDAEPPTAGEGDGL